MSDAQNIETEDDVVEADETAEEAAETTED